MLKTASGKICQISNSRRATYGYDQRIEVHGSQGPAVGRQCARDDGSSSPAKKASRADPVQNFFLERYTAAYGNEIEALHRGDRQGQEAEAQRR